MDRWLAYVVAFAIIGVIGVIVSIIRKSDFGVGVGEGLAAMRGHQSGAEGAAVAMPTFSREIETVSSVNIPLPGTNFFQ